MIGTAFSTISCPTYSVEQVMAAACDYGYDGVELYALDGQRLTPDLLSTQLDQLRRTFQPRTMPIVCLNSWAHLSSPDPDERMMQEAQILRSFQLAHELCCPLVKTFGGELPPERPAGEVYTYMAGSIARLCDHAARLGVRLVLETHDGFCRGSAVAELLQRVTHPAFAALWDIHHPYRMGETVQETAALIGPRVAHVHVKDAVLQDGAWHFVGLGEGVLPVSAMIDGLAMSGFAGYVSVDWEKMWHPDIAGPEIALPQYAAMLRQYIARAQAHARRSVPSANQPMNT